MKKSVLKEIIKEVINKGDRRDQKLESGIKNLDLDVNSLLSAMARKGYITADEKKRYSKESKSFFDALANNFYDDEV